MKEFDGKKLLVLGGLTMEREIVLTAQELGAYVIVADYYETSPAKEVADEAVLLSATDVDAIVNYCKKNSIDGVTTGFIDILLRPCLEACKRLGLPYYATDEMIEMSTNKAYFKKNCIKYGLPVPQTYYIGGTLTKELESSLHYPVFVKPLDDSGSRGAGKCSNQEELILQFAKASDRSKTKQVIIEEYITGVEFLLDYVGVDGEWRLLSVFDRYMCDDRDSARNYANLSIAPSKVIDKYLAEINDKVVNMFKSMGFKDGLIFLQGHFDGKNITFYEMGCRLGGSFFKLEKECINLDPVEMTIRYALTGKMVKNINAIPVDISRFSKYAIAYNYLLKEGNETIAEIKGLDKIKQDKAYVSSIQQKYLGDRYKIDGIVDRPLITFYMVYESWQKVLEAVDILCDAVEVNNELGQSILKKRIKSKDIR